MLLSTSTCFILCHILQERWFPDILPHEKQRAVQLDSHFTRCFAVSKQHLAQLVWNCDFLAFDLCHVRFQGGKKIEHSEPTSPLVPFSAHLVSFSSEAFGQMLMYDLQFLPNNSRDGGKVRHCLPYLTIWRLLWVGLTVCMKTDSRA